MSWAEPIKFLTSLSHSLNQLLTYSLKRRYFFLMLCDSKRKEIWSKHSTKSTLMTLIESKGGRPWEGQSFFNPRSKSSALCWWQFSSALLDINTFNVYVCLKCSFTWDNALLFSRHSHRLKPRLFLQLSDYVCTCTRISISHCTL